jgi:hypothetical protein
MLQDERVTIIYVYTLVEETQRLLVRQYSNKRKVRHLTAKIPAESKCHQCLQCK